MVIYLPSHTSHITQPCDKGPFAPLKEFYRQEVAFTSFIPGTAAINKRLTIQAYKKASEKAFNQRNILSGFSHTSIMPFNPRKVLNPIGSDGTLRDKNNEEIRPTTPPRVYGSAIRTPKKAEDLFAMANRLVDGQNAIKQDVQTLVAKTGKVLDESLGEIATLRDKNTRLNTLVKELQPRKKQRIQKDPNAVFADVQKAMSSPPSPSRGRRRRSGAYAADPQEISYATVIHREDELQHQ